MISRDLRPSIMYACSVPKRPHGSRTPRATCCASTRISIEVDESRRRRGDFVAASGRSTRPSLSLGGRRRVDAPPKATRGHPLPLADADLATAADGLPPLPAAERTNAFDPLLPVAIF